MFGWFGNLGKTSAKARKARKARKSAPTGWERPSNYDGSRDPAARAWYILQGKPVPEPVITKSYAHWDNRPGASRPWLGLKATAAQKRAAKKAVAVARKVAKATKSTATVQGQRVTIGRPRSKAGRKLDLHCGCKIINTKGGSGKAVVCADTAARRFISKADAAKAKGKKNVCAYMAELKQPSRRGGHGYRFTTTKGVPVSFKRRPSRSMARKMTAYFWRQERDRLRSMGKKRGWKGTREPSWKPPFAGFGR